MRRLWALLALVGLLVASVEVPAHDFIKYSMGGGFVPTPPPGPPVNIVPGQDWDSTVSANPESTTFIIKAGIHGINGFGVLDSPKTGNTFQGEDGAILSGGVTLTGWVLDPDRNGAGNDLWYTVTDIASYGAMEEIPWDPPCYVAGDSGCIMNEDLVFNSTDMLYQRWEIDSVTTDAEWYHDTANDTIWVHRDPSLQIVEITTGGLAGIANRRTPAADNVAIKNLIVEKFSVNAQGGAGIQVGDGEEWLIQDCEVRFNHGAGVEIQDNTLVGRCKIHHNGLQGVTGFRSIHSIVRYCDIYANDWQEFAWGFGGGGTTIDQGFENTWHANHVYDNKNWGVWADGCTSVVWSQNLIEGNHQGGIAAELTRGGCVISGNTIRNNGRIDLRGGVNIHIVDSKQVNELVRVIGNTVSIGDSSDAPAYYSRFALRIDSDVGGRSDGTMNLQVRYNDFTWGNFAQIGFWNSGPDTAKFDFDGPDLEGSFDFNTYTVGNTGATWEPFLWPETGTGGEGLEFQAWSETWSFNDLNSTHDSS